MRSTPRKSLRARQSKPRRIAQEKVIAAERIAADQETRSRDIAREEAIEDAEIKRREAIETARITTELALERERIASSQSREILDTERRKVIEIADQNRSIEVAAKLAERAEADRRVKEANIVATQHVERTDVMREQSH